MLVPIKFEKVKRKDFLKMQRQYLENMSGIIKMETGIDIDPNSFAEAIRFSALRKQNRAVKNIKHNIEL